jgi:hypothetical protein
MLVTNSAANTVAGAATDSLTISPVRLPDQLFNDSTTLFGQTVTCSNTSDASYVFALETWSCYNLRVSSEPMRTCHPSGFGVDLHCNDRDGKNDIGALCKHLLTAHGINRRLRAALFTSDESCKSRRSSDQNLRMVFRPDGKSFRWEAYSSGQSGCLKTLRCMLSN